MRAVVQRVSQGRVEVDGRLVNAIAAGLVVFVCAMDDEAPDITAWAKRLCGLRVFPDATGKMNQSLLETGGSLLLVSQFTLSADMKKGLRPSFKRASNPPLAAQQIEALTAACAALGVPTFGGEFGADMKVTLCNDGPVTLFIDKP